MIESFIIVLLSLSIVLHPQQTPKPEPVKQKVQNEIVKFHTVQEGDSILLIAKNEYGSEDFFTNVLNDNQWIEDPNLIEKGQRIKIKGEKPGKPAELSKKFANFSIKTDIAYADVEKEDSKPSQKVSNTPTPGVTEPPKQPATQTGTGPLSEDQINFLGTCESHMNPATNTGNGFYGAFQFTIGTWNSMGTGYARADLAPIEVQKDAVQRLVSRSNIFGQFPACSQRMRANGLL